MNFLFGRTALFRDGWLAAAWQRATPRLAARIKVRLHQRQLALAGHVASVSAFPTGIYIGDCHILSQSCDAERRKCHNEFNF